MIEPGITFDGYDERGHLFVVLSRPTASDQVVVANLTSHYPDLPNHDEVCVIVRPEEHPWVRRDSWVHYERVVYASVSDLDRVIGEDIVRIHPSCSARLLKRIQEGALASNLVRRELKVVIRASLIKNL